MPDGTRSISSYSFYGAPHGGTQAQGRLVIWNDAANTWAIGPNPTSHTCYSTSPYCVQHAYDHFTTDTTTGDLYYRTYSETVINHYTYSTGTWGTITPLPSSVGDHNCCEAMFYQPQIGGLVYVDVDWGIWTCTGTCYTTGSGAWVQVANTDATSTPGLPYVTGLGTADNIENVAVYNSENQTAMLANGTVVWEMTWSGSAWVFTSKGTAPTYMAINSALVTFESVHGKYIVLDGSSNLWLYDIAADSWTNTGVTAPFNAEDGAVAAAIPVYGVTMFVQYNGSTGGVYIYKP